MIFRDHSNFLKVGDTSGQTGAYYDLSLNNIENIVFIDTSLGLTTTTFASGGLGWGTAMTYTGTSSGETITGTGCCR